jgi:integrase
MACVVPGSKRGRPGRWLVDWTDARGRRRIETFKSESAANRRLAAVLLEGPRADGMDPRTPLSAAADLYLQTRAPKLERLTLEKYQNTLECHIIPTFGDVPVEKISKLQIELWVASLLREKQLAEASVFSYLVLLNSILAFAERHGAIAKNPAAHVNRDLGLKPSEKSKIRALDDGSLRATLGAAKDNLSVDAYEKLAVLAHTGTAYSEACGLQWPDLDLARLKLSVVRKVNRLAEVKTKLKTEARKGIIDIPAVLGEILKGRQAWLRAEAFAAGRPMSPWILHPSWPAEGPTRESYYRDYMRLRAVLSRALRYAGLARNAITIHGLRHSYISSLLAANMSPAYVQKQARHATIGMTVDRYGSWLTHDRPDELDRRAERTSPGRAAE